MLSYAYQPLIFRGYRRIATEDFDNIADLCSEILLLGLNRQIKQGLRKDYVQIDENTFSIKGKININESINSLSILKRQLNCTYDDYSVNYYLNQIIKTTLDLLLHSVSNDNLKKRLRKILFYFSKVDKIEINNINWNIRYDRNNQDYQMLIEICRLALSGELQTKEDGTRKLMDFNERDIHLLFEKFVLNYYKKHFHLIINVSSPYINWPLDNEEDNVENLLPRMESDIVLSSPNKFLIIDTKYYPNIFNYRYNTTKFESSHLYQIFTYVKSMEYSLNNIEHDLSGMLLYAKTNEVTQPNHDYWMDGNKISLKNLDLNTNFENICDQLDSIVYEYFELDQNDRID